MTVTIHHGDCRDILATLEEASVHSVVTDPPYHLTSVSRGGHARTNNPDSPHGRHRIGDKGFMGKVWDGGGVAFDPATWRAVLRVMKPGAYLLAFGGTRTYHRLACTIEDAGFEIRDQLAWVYGSGFPKGTDKAKIPPGWEGFNTALKPAWEPIVLARKPMVGSLAANLQAHGCGALNIDGCRIETADNVTCTGDGFKSEKYGGQIGRGEATMKGEEWTLPGAGRWPANVVHDGSEEVLQHFPDAPGQIADAKTDGSGKFGNVYSPMSYGRDDEPSADSDNEGVVGFKMKPGARRGDEGSAARFFYCAKAGPQDRNDGLQRVNAKPLKNHHPTVKPTDLMVWLCKLVTPPGGVILDPFMGSGSTGRGAVLGDFQFIGIDQEAEHIEIARRRIRAISPLFIAA